MFQDRKNFTNEETRAIIVLSKETVASNPHTVSFNPVTIQ